LTKSLDIKLIATAIETKEEYETLKEMSLSLLQGAYIEEPTI
jgi:EAL domain-containing protein (putative c-di-GMP-specific phosphodiesterase class I)